MASHRLMLYSIGLVVRIYDQGRLGYRVVTLFEFDTANYLIVTVLASIH